MPKASLRYNLSDPDDSTHHRLALIAAELHIILLDVDNYLRNQIKYEDHEPQYAEALEAVRTYLHDAVSIRNREEIWDL